ncbi:hypothetical protein vBSlqSZDD2_48 [Serratia phage vB_SlqS_ZDD2]|nr:hypothetical protein vBSlqSZDD2_48 [Serratia phage vB_SlqS_ZDD2]
MQISKTTLNFAKRRGIELSVVEIEDGELIAFWDDADETTGEWMFSYRNNTHELSWNGNIYLSQRVKEELPATISSEAKLRETIKFLADNRQDWTN